MIQLVRELIVMVRRIVNSERTSKIVLHPFFILIFTRHYPSLSLVSRKFRDFVRWLEYVKPVFFDIYCPSIIYINLLAVGVGPRGISIF
jgi:hypothetical protein